MILNDFKKILLAIDGIETVWTEQELLSLTFPKNSIESWYQLQHHGIRSGDMTVKVTPYTYLTRFETGTSHCTPYKYDVEVPALFYSPGRIKGNQTINTPVSMLSLPATIADILKIPRPESAIPEKFPLK